MRKTLLVTIALCVTAYNMLFTSAVKEGTYVIPIDSMTDQDDVSVKSDMPDVIITRARSGEKASVEFSGKDCDKFDLTVDTSAGAVQIEVKRKQAVSSRWPFGCQAQLEIKLPSGWHGGDLSASVVSGSLQVLSALSCSSAQLATVSGGLSANTLSGASSVLLQSVSGSISARRIETGLLDVSTVSGKIDIEGSSHALNASSMSGSIVLTGMGSKQATIDTASGTVEYSIPKDFNGSLTAKTLTGTIVERMWKHPVASSSGKTRTFAIGDGSDLIRISTISGGIMLKN
jgi:hypothetical protein